MKSEGMERERKEEMKRIPPGRKKKKNKEDRPVGPKKSRRMTENRGEPQLKGQSQRLPQ
jgi:hypothetical protein